MCQYGDWCNEYGDAKIPIRPPQSVDQQYTYSISTEENNSPSWQIRIHISTDGGVGYGQEPIGYLTAETIPDRPGVCHLKGISGRLPMEVRRQLKEFLFSKGFSRVIWERWVNNKVPPKVKEYKL